MFERAAFPLSPTTMPAFALAKQCLLAPNLLPSSWDVALHPLLDLINSSTAHVTTSSCSGRILVYSAADADPEPGEAPFAEALAEDSESSVNIPDEADDESVDGGTPDSGKGQGKARSTTVNGRTGGATLWSSHNVVDVPREEWQVLRLLFKVCNPPAPVIKLAQIPILNPRSPLPMRLCASTRSV